MILTTYDEIREDLEVGDLFFFGGAITGALWHVAAVISRDEDDSGETIYRPAELIGARPGEGCARTPAEWLVNTYRGRVWWAPLARLVRRDRFEEDRFVELMLAKQGPSSRSEALVSGGSETIADGLRRSGVLPNWPHTRACASPAELAEKRIFGNLLQVKGRLRRIPRFNTIDVNSSEISISNKVAARLALLGGGTPKAA